MSSSANHKRIIYAGMGCAVGLIGLVVFGVIVALRERPDLLSEIASVSEYATPAMAADALDSLQRVDWRLIRGGPLLGFAVGDGDGAVLAARIWRLPKLKYATVPYGDTAAEGSRRRTIWRSHADEPWVDSLIGATQLPWQVTNETDTTRQGGAVVRQTLSAYPVLNTTRALLARADTRWPSDSAAAYEATHAAIAIGRRLQADPSLIHRAIGLRVEREVLQFLLSRQRSFPTAPTLARADSAIAAIMEGLRLIRVAGGAPENSAALARAARDETLPLAVRREALIAIGYGWALNMKESGTMTTMVPRDNERNRELEGIEPSSLPRALRVILADARATADFGFGRRVVLGPEYASLTASLRSNW